MMDIDWNRYLVVAFIDSNVALECHALEQLPWSEVHNTGPILVLLTPTVLKEVDSKKNHARLGDHARRFNRTLRPLLGEQETVVVRPSPAPLVEVALADCDRVDWERYPDLDPVEPDSKIIAQVLCARGPSHESRLVISQDIRPLSLAKRHGLRIHQIGEKWLRPKETSESEKKVAYLQREIDAMKSKQPKLDLSFSANKDVVSLHRIRDISIHERETIRDTIIRLHPIAKQERDFTMGYSTFDGYDHTLSDRYKRWKDEVVPRFVTKYERKLELNFGQVEIFFRIENSGQVPAESLLIHLSARGGWLNDRYILASPAGPSAPRVRKSSLFGHPNVPDHRFSSIVPPGSHEFVVLKKPARSTEVQIACADFRQGFDYEYRVIGWVDPRADGFGVEAVVTAANLYGEIRATFTVTKTEIESSVHDLIDPETLKFRQAPEVVDLLTDSVRKRNISDFEFDDSDWDK